MEISHRSFYIKEPKLGISLDQQPEMWCSLFLLCTQVLNCWSLALTLYKAFSKNKKSLEIVTLPHFLHEFWRKIFLMLYSINWPNFVLLLHLLLKIFGSMCIVVICLAVCDVISLKLTFLIKPFSYITKRPRQKFKYLKKEKSF